MGAADLTVRVQVGDAGAILNLLAVGNRASKNYTNPLALADEKHERLQIEFANTGLEVHTLGPWLDRPNEPLEAQLTAIATEVLVRGEMSHRANLAYRRSWALQHLEAREAAARKARLQLEAEELERVTRLEKARLDHLLGLANSLEQSEQIRALVQAMKARDVEDPEIGRWCEWATQTADTLDPRLWLSSRLFPPSPT